ncbi:hypothetical protein K466DRAFT_658633 [Polyporus arcularius HHB13444]|uniref:F-box domain-containing protein n=1 Tax=Polyporus arcularius HHB13444 TaxID=1314778 RepID=A0A5C3PUD7_9APHY|nr:hypothetical protein K466DRAFT_658633 [Polyporus arcularius HHB13444]
MYRLQLQRHHLPPELQLLIIDAAADMSQDWTTKLDILRACALTCHAWLPTARRHLYSTVYLRSPIHSRLLSRTLADNPAIFPLICRLHCAGITSAGLQIASSTEEGYPLTTDTVSKLSSLRSVVFTIRAGTPPYFLPLVRSFSVLEHLDSLCIQNAANTYLDMVHVIWSFPAVRSIELDGCAWWKVAPIADDSAYPYRCRNLRDLKIRIPGMLEVEPYLHIFASRAEKITNLLLWCDDMGEDALIELRAYRRLESLDLGAIESEGAWMVEALSNVRSDHLRHLSLTFRSHEAPLETVLKTWCDSRLDDALSAIPFLGLKCLTINLIGNSSLESTRDTIAHIFPRCHGRGILNFDMRSREHL